MRARFRGFSFAPHRHDTYAVGITTFGVQAFDYRGASRKSGRGQAFVLHPDERHDGRAGTDDGFGYSIAYVDPSLVRDAAGGGSLPFLRDPVSTDPRLFDAVRDVLATGAEAFGIDAVSVVSRLAEIIRKTSGAASAKPLPLDLIALRRVETVLRDTRDRRVSMRELERESGLSRWELARQFRAYSGVSLARFNLLRRLDAVQSMIGDGQSIAEAAAACGFVDQAHMTRSFKKANGVTPGQWRRLAGTG